MSTAATRLGEETIEITRKLATKFIFPLDSDGTSTLSYLMLHAAVNQRIRSATHPEVTKISSIKLLGHLDKNEPSIFKSKVADLKIPTACHLKNTDDETLTLRQAKTRKYDDISNSGVPYIVCCIPHIHQMPIEVDLEQFESQLKRFQVAETATKTSKRNQHCTFGAFITTFHRDTMFSTKVHTLSPGSMKLWCFEKTIGQLNLESEEAPETQMQEVTTHLSDYNFFLQEPGEVIEHDGGYAHFVITFNRHTSPYGQWSALIGWEINTPRQIYQSMQIETPLLQGKGGTLEVVTKESFLRGCSKTTKMSYTRLMEQESVQEQFYNRQKLNSMKRVDRLENLREKNLKRYAGLKNKSQQK